MNRNRNLNKDNLISYKHKFNLTNASSKRASDDDETKNHTGTSFSYFMKPPNRN
jgi:hypothetical protein